MKNSKALFNDFANQLNLGENKEEVQSIAFLVFENLFGLSRAQIMADKEVNIPSEWLQEISRRLNSNEPVQYILGEASFFDRNFKVSPAVLIPRPETEELVQYVIDQAKQFKGPLRILDIGTGSGCIPITLSLELPGSEVIATDVSKEALKVAKQNNELLQANVKFIKHNIVRESLPVTEVDIVVSNPPYISDEEKSGMKNNVLSYEPHLALFVEGDDPLIFYKKIARQAKKVLRKPGMLCVEINEHFGKETAAIFEQSGFSQVSIVRDLQGKERIISGILTS
jgi:release factor glutamine methyltransferase